MSGVSITTLNTGQNHTNLTQKSKYGTSVYTGEHLMSGVATTTSSTGQNRTNLTQKSKCNTSVYTVHINVWGLHRKPKHWSEPHKFNPEK